MRRRLLALTLYLATQAAIADEISVTSEDIPPAVLVSNPPPQLTSSSFQAVKSLSSTQVPKALPPAVEVTRDEQGRIRLDGKLFPERHPIFEKRVAKPVKTVLKPAIILDHKSGFHKLRHLASDFVIAGGAKFKPYEPAAGAVITASQLTNLVRGYHR